MKKTIQTPVLFFAIACVIISAGCAKGVKDPITLDKAAGKWSINAIRMQVLYGTTLAKDSTVPWRPVVENFVHFDGVSTFQYCFNSQAVSPGQYALNGTDSINMQVGDENGRWKIDLLTQTNFNIQSTSNNNNEFPGATVITYKGFVR